jgi:Fe2+ transport system protein FeoA
MNPHALLPLDLLRPGEWADVAEVDGDPGWVCRMAELGLQTGCRVQMLQGGTPYLLRVAGCKLCVRGDESAQILVRPVEGGVGCPT